MNDQQLTIRKDYDGEETEIYYKLFYRHKGNDQEIDKQ